MGKYFTKAIVLLLLSTFPLSLMGCWNNRDITKQAFVAAMGIDKGPNDMIQLTIQVVKPSTIKSSQNGGSSEQAVWTDTSEGETLFEAIRNQLKTVNRRPFFSHMQLIILGEELAKESIMDVLDLIERDPETRLTPYILIAKGMTAKQVLVAKSDLEDIPAMHIKELLEHNDALGNIVAKNLYEILQMTKTVGYSSAIGVIEPKHQHSEIEIKHMKVEQAAVFKDNKLVGYLTPEETRGLLFITDDIKSCILNIKNPLVKDKKVAIEVLDSKRKMDVTMSKDQLSLMVHIKGIGNLAEQQGKGDLSSEQMIETLEEEVENDIKKLILGSLKKTQDQYQSDIYGFCRIMHHKYPEYWHEIKGEWNDLFSASELEIDVEFTIQRTGLITKQVETK